MTTLSRYILAVFLLLAAPASAVEPILVVTRQGDPQTAMRFSLSDLDALGVEEVVTTSPWHDGPVRYSGVRLKRLLELWPGTVDEIHVSALNDYSVLIPANQARNHRIILASRRDGVVMAVRDKGPLWIIYPISEEPALDTTLNHGRMVWQVSRIDLR